MLVIHYGGHRGASVTCYFFGIFDNLSIRLALFDVVYIEYLLLVLEVNLNVCRRIYLCNLIFVAPLVVPKLSLESNFGCGLFYSNLSPTIYTGLSFWYLLSYSTFYFLACYIICIFASFHCSIKSSTNLPGLYALSNRS